MLELKGFYNRSVYTSLPLYVTAVTGKINHAWQGATTAPCLTSCLPCVRQTWDPYVSSATRSQNDIRCDDEISCCDILGVYPLMAVFRLVVCSRGT